MAERIAPRRFLAEFTLSEAGGLEMTGKGAASVILSRRRRINAERLLKSDPLLPREQSSPEVPIAARFHSDETSHRYDSR